MFRTLSLSFCVCSLLLAALAAPALAENEGQDDLDKATQLKVAAENLDDLGEVIDHVDTAIEKGLDKDNKKFAEQLLAASLLQRGQLFAAAVFNVPAQDPQRGIRSMQFRQFALSDLQRVVSMDDKDRRCTTAHRQASIAAAGRPGRRAAGTFEGRRFEGRHARTEGRGLCVARRSAKRR